MRTTFRMEEENITMVRGDTLSFGLEIEDQDGDPVVLDSAFFSCKSNKTDYEYVFQKSLGDGITVDADGNYIVRVAPSDTADADAGQYFYDFQIGINDDIYTILLGTLDLLQDITIGG